MNNALLLIVTHSIRSVERGKRLELRKEASEIGGNSCVMGLSQESLCGVHCTVRRSLAGHATFSLVRGDCLHFGTSRVAYANATPGQAVRLGTVQLLVAQPSQLSDVIYEMTRTDSELPVRSERAFEVMLGSHAAVSDRVSLLALIVLTGAAALIGTTRSDFLWKLTTFLVGCEGATTYRVDANEFALAFECSESDARRAISDLAAQLRTAFSSDHVMRIGATRPALYASVQEAIAALRRQPQEQGD